MSSLQNVPQLCGSRWDYIQIAQRLHICHVVTKNFAVKFCQTITVVTITLLRTFRLLWAILLIVCYIFCISGYITRLRNFRPKFNLRERKTIVFIFNLFTFYLKVRNKNKLLSNMIYFLLRGIQSRQKKFWSEWYDLLENISPLEY